jgi:hypothetical protein
MKILDLNAVNLDTLSSRVQSLTPDAEAQWGKLDATRMLRHLRRTIESSLEQVEAKDISKPVLRQIIRVLFFEVFTKWPGGKFKAPAYFTPPAEGAFEEEQTRLLDSMKTFAEECGTTPKRKTLSPLLGQITLSYWAHVHGVHMNHHFRQFSLS